MSRKEYAGGPVPRYLLLGAAVFLTAFGLTMVYSASSISALVKEGSSAHYFLRQIVFVLMGAVLAFVAARIDYRRFQGQLGVQAWWVAVALLVLTYGLGVVRGGARRWIPLGFVNLQPSEFAKIACVLVAAALAVEWQRGRIDSRTFMGRVGIYVGVPAVLIVFQPDLGTAVLLAVGRRNRAVARRHRAALGRGRRRGRSGRSARSPSPRRATGWGASWPLSNPWLDPSGKGYQIDPGDARVRHRRARGRRARALPPEVLLPARGAHRLHLRHHRRGGRA